MKIISYNVNGIRAAMNKGLAKWIEASQPDILCLQEIKASIWQIDTKAFEYLGYHHYWLSAKKKGYSGVGILSKTKPEHVTYITGLNNMDGEGRVIRADFKEYSIISLYLPSGSNMQARLNFKLQFMDDFFHYIQEIKQKHPNIIISGDYNICHEAIDIHDAIRNTTMSGFLPIERAWMTKFIKSGFIDSFRHLIKEPHHYSWWSYRTNARVNNKGWRIDYNMVSKPLESKIKRVLILSEVQHSDHCPVVLEIEI